MACACALAAEGYLIRQNKQRIQDVQTSRRIALGKVCVETNNLKGVAVFLIGTRIGQLPPRYRRALLKEHCQVFVARSTR